MSLQLVVSVIVVIVVLLAVDALILAIVLRRRRRRRDVAAERGDGAAAEGLGAEAGENAPVALAGARRAPWPILAIVFSSLGLALVLAAGISAAVVAESISGDRHADGTVVDLVSSGRGYRAVVEFSAPSGAPIRFTSSVSTNPPPAQVGEHVGVRYKPDNPQDADIDQYWQTWFLPTLLGILGAPFLLVGIGFSVVTFVLRRRSRTQPAR